jgi:hypothetical protein
MLCILFIMCLSCSFFINVLFFRYFLKNIINNYSSCLFFQGWILFNNFTFINFHLNVEIFEIIVHLDKPKAKIFCIISKYFFKCIYLVLLDFSEKNQWSFLNSKVEIVIFTSKLSLNGF